MKTFFPIEAVVRHIERQQASQHVSTLKLCPVCDGAGELDTPDNMGPSVPKCPVCKGVKFVDMASTCCCGMPAVFIKDEALYCGRDACFTSMKHKRTTGMGC